MAKTFKVGDFVGFTHRTPGSDKPKRRGNIESIKGTKAVVNCSGDKITVPLSKLEKLA